MDISDNVFCLGLVVCATVVLVVLIVTAGRNR